MTTLTIQIPDDSRAVIKAISEMVDKVGGNISIDPSSDDNLSEAEFEALKSSYKEALSIKNGKAQGISVSELWND